MAFTSRWRTTLIWLIAAALLAAGCASSSESVEQLSAVDTSDTTSVDDSASVSEVRGDAADDGERLGESSTDEAAAESTEDTKADSTKRQDSVSPAGTTENPTTDDSAAEDSAADDPTDQARPRIDDALQAAPVTNGRPAAPNGRTAPIVAPNPVDLAAQISAAEAGLVDPASTAAERADWGHLHQVAIRKLGYEPDWDIPFFEALPREHHSRTLLHVSARRALSNLLSGYDAADFIPAWEIIEPESAAALLSHYQEAEAATGIEWEFLAGINLVETGMGRIRGLSSAGAQGPMQFLPTTWNEAGIGQGDINDPRDAINGAARYLVRRGGPADMPGALWGYNNSDDYVTAVRAYAELLRDDPAAFEAIYNWEIYFFTDVGDVWLPTGLRVEETTDLADYLAANPWSEPDPGLR